MEEQKGEDAASSPSPVDQSQPRESVSWGKKIDGLLIKLDRRLGNLETAKQQAADVAQKGTPNSSLSVQQKRCLFLALEPLGEVEDVVQGAFVCSTKSGRRRLHQLGDNDCDRIARLRTLTQAFADAAEGSHMALHPRLKGCNHVCDVAEAVMKDSGLSARLAGAKKREQEAFEKRKALIEPSPEESSKRALPEESSKRALPPVDREECMRLFRKLDQVDEGLDSPVLSIADRIFDIYDKDGNTLVEGDEYDQVIADLAAHVLQEAQARAKKYGSMSFVPSEELLKDWITQVVDPNLDGAITREEARIGFKKVVDDIDDP